MWPEIGPVHGLLAGMLLTQRMTFSMQARQKTWAHSVMQGCCMSLRQTAQSSVPPACIFGSSAFTGTAARDKGLAQAWVVCAVLPFIEWLCAPLWVSIFKRRAVLPQSSAAL